MLKADYYVSTLIDFCASLIFNNTSKDLNKSMIIAIVLRLYLHIKYKSTKIKRR